MRRLLSDFFFFKVLVAMLSSLRLVAGSKHVTRVFDSANLTLREYGSRVEKHQTNKLYVAFFSSLMYCQINDVVEYS